MVEVYVLGFVLMEFLIGDFVVNENCFVVYIDELFVLDLMVDEVLSFLMSFIELGEVEMFVILGGNLIFDVF